MIMLVIGQLHLGGVEWDDYAAVIAALEQLHAAGCPLPTPEQRERIAKVAFWRSRSLDRRSRARRPSRANRIRDLAHGLTNVMEADPRQVGPLMRDYECLAEAFAAAVDPVANEGENSSVQKNHHGSSRQLFHHDGDLQPGLIQGYGRCAQAPRREPRSVTRC